MTNFWDNFQNVVQESMQNVEKLKLNLKKLVKIVLNAIMNSSIVITKTGARFIGCSNFLTVDLLNKIQITNQNLDAFTKRLASKVEYQIK